MFGEDTKAEVKSRFWSWILMLKFGQILNLMYVQDSEEESLSSYDGNDLKAVKTWVKALNPCVCCAFGNFYLSTLNTRKVIYGVSFFLHGKKILKIQLMIRLQILCSSWSSPSCKKNVIVVLVQKVCYFHCLLSLSWSSLFCKKLLSSTVDNDNIFMFSS